MDSKYYGAAAKYGKPSGPGLNRRLIMMVVLGLVLLVFLVVGYILVNTVTSGPKNDLARLVARENSLRDFISANQEHIRSADLAKINSDANLLILTDAVSLQKSLLDAYGLKKPPDDILESEIDTTSEAKLQEAIELGKFDRTYMQFLRDKLVATYQIAQKISNSASGEVKANVKKAADNLKIVDEQLGELKL